MNATPSETSWPRSDPISRSKSTSGGLNKLDVYRKLGVREVWYWRRGAITPFVLRGETDEEVPASKALTGLDLRELARYLDRPTTSLAIRDYREALRQRT
jgi:hypothetical protein